MDDFGSPVLRQPFEDNGVKKERWLYRYPTKFEKVPKVYFIVNDQGGVEEWYKVDPSAPGANAKNDTHNQP